MTQKSGHVCDTLPFYLLYCLIIISKARSWNYCVLQFQISSSFLKIKPTRCTNFSNLFLEWNSTCFRQFLCPSSGVFHCTYGNGICHTGLLTACEQNQDGTEFHPDPARKLSAKLYDIHHCCVYGKNSWWWTEELSETCRVSFQKQIWVISASSWFYFKKFITMHCHINVLFLTFRN